MEYEKEENVEKGEKVEDKFQRWLNKHKIPYLYIQQDKETFSSAFNDLFPGKRPDFLILIQNFGFIFVDVKYKKISKYGDYPIDAEETKKYSSMQRKFNIPTWFVVSNEDFDFKTWLWIPVSRVLELGIMEKKSTKSGQDFFPIPPEEFIQIADDDSLDRLFSKSF